MDLKIALSGDLPARCSDALAALAPELGMVPAAEGVPVRGHRGAALAVCCDGASVTIEWAQPIQFYRALSLLPRPLRFSRRSISHLLFSLPIREAFSWADTCAAVHSQVGTLPTAPPAG